MKLTYPSPTPADALQAEVTVPGTGRVAEQQPWEQLLVGRATAAAEGALPQPLHEQQQ